MSDYSTRLNDAIRRKQTPALVGLDPRFNRLPGAMVSNAGTGLASVEDQAAAYVEFCCRVVDIVAPLVPAVKPQAAFFEELGPAGCAALREVIHYARSAGLIVICDAKRGDIGSTAEAYARAYLAGEDPMAAVWGADALTISPYLGADTLQPFVDVALERAAGLYVLVRTSNPGAGTFQDRLTEGSPLYRGVASVVEELALQTCGGDGFAAVGAVVGATWPSELAELRAAMPHAPLLVPGYGSQGAGAADVSAAFRDDGLGALVNSSRGILFAYDREPYRSQFQPTQWEQAVEAATREMIADLATHTPAGALRNA